MKASELKQMSTDELKEAILSAEASLKSLRFSHAVAPVENPMRIKSSRKDIARMKTELHTRTISSVEASISAGDLTEDNAREFLQAAKLPAPMKLAKIKNILGKTAK